MTHRARNQIFLFQLQPVEESYESFTFILANVIGSVGRCLDLDLAGAEAFSRSSLRGSV